jgi:hypothetical protein
LGSNHFIAANKTKQNWKLKQLTLQEKCIVHEAIKIWCVERWPDFCRWRRGCLGGIPKLWRLYLLDISWGAWASPSLIFCPFFNSSHHSPIPTLETFLYTKLNTILVAILV